MNTTEECCDRPTPIFVGLLLLRGKKAVGELMYLIRYGVMGHVGRFRIDGIQRSSRAATSS